MKIDFTPYFEKYEDISATADELFLQEYKKSFQNGVTCEIKCADCCHALFDLTLIEAIYINHQFNKTFKGKEKETDLWKSRTVRIEKLTWLKKKHIR